MIYKVSISTEALDDALSIFDYYEEEKQGLGEQFFSKLAEAYQKLEKFPSSYQVIRSNNIRRTLMSTFPYSVFYTIKDSDEVVIIRILHQRKNPQEWPH